MILKIPFIVKMAVCVATEMGGSKLDLYWTLQNNKNWTGVGPCRTIKPGLVLDLAE